jgi:hypothetical protein
MPAPTTASAPPSALAWFDPALRLRQWSPDLATWLTRAGAPGPAKGAPLEVLLWGLLGTPPEEARAARRGAAFDATLADGGALRVTVAPTPDDGVVVVVADLEPWGQRVHQHQTVETLAQVGGWRADLDTGAVTLSDEARALFRPEELAALANLGDWHKVLWHGSDSPPAPLVAALRHRGAPFDHEFACTEGHARRYQARARPVRDARGALIGAEGLFQLLEVSEGAAPLHASMAPLQLLAMEGAGFMPKGGTALLDPQGELHFVSARLARVLGGAPTGRPVTALLHPDDAPKVQAILQTGTAGATEARIQAVAGAPWLAELATQPLGAALPGWTALDVDVRSPREAHGQLQGLLADLRVGFRVRQQHLAFDFRNILAVAQGTWRIVADDVQGLDPGLEADLDQAFAYLSLLGHSLDELRPEPWNTVPTTPAAPAIRAGLGLARQLLGRGSKLEVAVAHNLGEVRGTPACLEQAVLGLVLEARLSAPTGTEISVTADRVTQRVAGPLRPGAYLRLAVHDQGPPLHPAEHPSGRAPGIGYLEAEEVATRFGGHVTVRGGAPGNVVELFLPEAPRSGEPRRPRRWPRGAGQAVLALEPHELGRALLTHVLTRLGYRAHVTVTLAKAAELLASNVTLDAVLMLANESQPELTHALERLRPGLLKVVPTHSPLTLSTSPRWDLETVAAALDEQFRALR